MSGALPAGTPGSTATLCPSNIFSRSLSQSLFRSRAKANEPNSVSLPTAVSSFAFPQMLERLLGDARLRVGQPEVGGGGVWLAGEEQRERRLSAEEGFVSVEGSLQPEAGSGYQGRQESTSGLCWGPRIRLGGEGRFGKRMPKATAVQAEVCAGRSGQPRRRRGPGAGALAEPSLARRGATPPAETPEGRRRQKWAGGEERLLPPVSSRASDALLRGWRLHAATRTPSRWGAGLEQGRVGRDLHLQRGLSREAAGEQETTPWCGTGGCGSPGWR